MSFRPPYSDQPPPLSYYPVYPTQQPPPGQHPYQHNPYITGPGYYPPQAPHPPPPGHFTPYGFPPYHPRVGFTNLSPSFHIWNTMTSSGTSVLSLRPHPSSPPAYSAKMFSASRLKIKSGAYESGGPQPTCTIESRHTFSSKSTISFQGFQTEFKESSEFDEGATWPFEVEVSGMVQRWQWMRTKSESALKAFRAAMSDRKFGSWVLVPVGGNGQPAATFSPTGSNTFEENVSLGFVEFHGPAAAGGLGDIFFNVAVAVLLRIISQHYISRIAAMAGG